MTVISASRSTHGLIRILIRALHPDEGLKVDHVAGAQITIVALHCFGKTEHTAVAGPIWLWLVGELEAVGAGGAAGHHRLKEDMTLGLSKKTPDRDERPGEDTGLATRQGGHNIPPSREFFFSRARFVQEKIQTLAEHARAPDRLHGVAQSHFFKREEQVSA
jgi:hypothetical protein